MNKKILLIDDNKMLGKLSAKKIQTTLNHEVNIVFSLAEVKASSNDEYFLTFVDLCLPDAPNGEIVDYVSAKNWPVVVLTASNDKATRDKSMDKDILDYIFKESNTCIDQIIDSTVKLERHAKTKIILVLSKLPECNEIKKIFAQREFNVLIAAHGEEAMSYLNDSSDVKLITADANTSVTNGSELLSEARVRLSDDGLGVTILGDKDDVLEVSLPVSGANEYLVKPLSKEDLNCHLDKYLHHMANMQFLSIYDNLDPISRIKDSNTLLNCVEDYLNEIVSKEEKFAFVFLDIDNLRNLNEEYGYEVGDKIIKICADEVINETKGHDTVGRYSTEKICIVLKDIPQEGVIKVLSHIRVNVKKVGVLVNLDEVFFTVSIGVVFAKSGDKSEILVDKASKALPRAKANGKDRVEVCS